MTLRGRLAWAFAAMLLVPLAIAALSAAGLRWWWNLSDAGSPPERGFRAVAVLNDELRRDPEGLVSGEGFDRLAASVPPPVLLGVRIQDRWVRTTPGFFDDQGGPFHGPRPQTLFVWNFDAAGQPAVLEVRWSPRHAMASGGGWIAAAMLGLFGLVVGTLVLLTVLVARSVLRPLKTLEAATRRLSDGDLEPGPLPSQPPEFRVVGLTLDDLRRRLKESLLERQALEEERRTWVAAVSHDLRTPLAVIRGYVEGLRDGVAATPEKRARYHEVILDRAQQLERQVDDLFQWARWDWGQPRLRRQRLDLAAELSAAVESWSDWPELEVTWNAPAEPCSIQGDAVALRRVFDNLARNVVHHAGQPPRLHLSLEAADGFTVRFRDEGPGIREDILPRVFERFFRGDPARSPAQGGGGLGLTIAQTLIEAHGGSISAANVEGGSEFTLRLPREAPL